MAKRNKNLAESIFGNQGSVDVLSELGSGGRGGGDRYSAPRRGGMGGGGMGGGGRPGGRPGGGSDYISRRFGGNGPDDGGDQPQQGWGRSSGGGGGNLGGPGGQGWGRGAGGGGGGGGGGGRYGDDRPSRYGDDRPSRFGDDRRGGNFGRGGDDGGDRFSRGGGGGGGGGGGAYVPPNRRGGDGAIRYERPNDDRHDSVFQNRHNNRDRADGGWNTVRSSKRDSRHDGKDQKQKSQIMEADEKLKREAQEKRKAFDLDENLANLELVEANTEPKLLEHLEDGSSVEEAKELQEGLGSIDQEDEDQLSALSRVISKSLGAGTVTLAEVLETLKDGLKKKVAASVLLSVIKIWRDGRSKEGLRELIDATTDNDVVLSVLYPALDENLVQFLESHDLSFLRSAGNVKEQVLAVFEENKADDAQAVAAVMKLLQETVDESLPLEDLLPEVAAMLAKRVFADDNLHLEPIATFAPLLHRVLKNESFEVQARLLFALQGVWFKNKKHKDVQKVFKALSHHDYAEEGIQGAKVLQDGAYYIWKDDLKDKTPGKPMLLIKVHSYIDTLTPPNPEPESEEDEDDDEDDQQAGDEDDYMQNPNAGFFR